MVRHALWAVVALVGMLGVALVLRPEGSAVPEDRPVDLVLPTERPLRVAVMGTSLTANYDWPIALEQRLADCLTNGVSVVTIAKAGASIRWGRGQVQSVAGQTPDLVFIEYAINDADLIDGEGLFDAKNLHTGLIGELVALEPSPAIALMTMSPAEGLRGWVRYRLADHYAQYRVVAAEQDVGLVDLYPRWLALNDRGLEADGLHPDPKVAQAVIVPALTRYIAEMAGIRCGATGG